MRREIVAERQHVAFCLFRGLPVGVESVNRVTGFIDSLLYMSADSGF
jgi:hypothetical protein